MIHCEISLLCSLIILKVNNRRLKAGGMKIGGLNRRLKEKTSKDSSFDHGPGATQAKAAAGTNKYRAAPVVLLNSYNKILKNTQLNQLPQEKSCLQPE